MNKSIAVAALALAFSGAAYAAENDNAQAVRDCTAKVNETQAQNRGAISGVATIARGFGGAAFGMIGRVVPSAGAATLRGDERAKAIEGRNNCQNDPSTAPAPVEHKRFGIF